MFRTTHITLTALITGALSFTLALLVGRDRTALADCAAIGLLSVAAVFLFRKLANMPQLNMDGLQGFSANDWLAPTITAVALRIYAAVRQPRHLRRYSRASAGAVVLALIVNVVAIRRATSARRVCCRARRAS